MIRFRGVHKGGATIKGFARHVVANKSKRPNVIDGRFARRRRVEEHPHTFVAPPRDTDFFASPI